MESIVVAIISYLMIHIGIVEVVELDSKRDFDAFNELAYCRILAKLTKESEKISKTNKDDIHSHLSPT